MEERVFAKRLVLNGTKSQMQKIKSMLDEANRNPSGDVSIIYEGNLPSALVKYLKENALLEIEEIQTQGTNLNEKMMYRIYPSANINEDEMQNVLEETYVRRGGRNMGEEYAKELMLSNMKKQIDTLLTELIELANSESGKGAVLHEGMIMTPIIKMLNDKKIKVEEIDTRGTDKADKKLYRVYPDDRIALRDVIPSSKPVTKSQAEVLLRSGEFSVYIKRKIAFAQKDKIVQGLVQKIGEPKGNISEKFEGLIYDEVIQYLEDKGIGIHELDTSQSSKVGESIYQTYPQARLPRETVENAIMGLIETKPLTPEEVRQLMTTKDALGIYLKSVSLASQISAVEKELNEAYEKGETGILHSGILYPEARQAWKTLGIETREINYAKTNKLGEFSYQVYPDVELEIGEIENAIIERDEER